MQSELILSNEPREVARSESPPAQPPANDLRHAMMSLPVNDQRIVLASYIERRQHFREWLMSQLIEGTHYGIVPGCEPKTKEIDGVLHYGVWNKKKGSGQGGFDWYPGSQWTPKPSLYAAGADFICDLMAVRDEYESDAVAWQQMGSKSGTAVQKCRLYSRATGELIGEAIGAYNHQYDPNNAVKMASKCAKVGAVINAYGLRDLFTQDEPTAPPTDNPEGDGKAPKVPPRGKRTTAATEVTPEHVKYVKGNWQGQAGNITGDAAKDRDRFIAWVCNITNREFDPLKVSQWTKRDVVECCGSLGIMHPWEEQP